jgi:hypothetical protein
MSSLCEIWLFIRAIDNQEPALVAIIKAILCTQFQLYLEECIDCPSYINDDKYKSVTFPRLHLRIETMIFLLEFGVSPNYDNFYGTTFLHYSLANNYLPDMVKILINYGADPKLSIQPMTKKQIEQDKKNEYGSNIEWHQINEGNNALHLILYDVTDSWNHNNEHGIACMKIILDKDPSLIYIKNAHGLTPWDMVKDLKNPTMKSIMEGYM